MTRVVDYTYRLSLETLRADPEITGVIRYLSDYSWKVITFPEYQELVGADYQVFLNWENYSTDWLDPANAEHNALGALRQARLLGYPPGKVIFGSCDIDLNFNQWENGAEQYARLWGQQIKQAGYVPGVYGSYDTLDWVHAFMDGLYGAYWQSKSTQFSYGRNAQQFPFVNFWQRYTYQGQYDVNDVVTPVQIGEIMRIAAVHDMPVERLWDGKSTPVTTSTRWFKGDGIKFVEITDWAEHDDEVKNRGAVERSFAFTENWPGWVGRTTDEKLNFTMPSQDGQSMG